MRNVTNRIERVGKTNPLAPGCRSSNGQKVNAITDLAQGIVGIEFEGHA